MMRLQSFPRQPTCLVLTKTFQQEPELVKHLPQILIQNLTTFSPLVWISGTMLRTHLGLQKARVSFTTTMMLDREAQGVYHLVVIATSTGSGQQNTTNVFVSVLDQNDNAPIIEFPNPFNNTVYVKQNDPSGQHHRLCGSKRQ